MSSDARPIRPLAEDTLRRRHEDPRPWLEVRPRDYLQHGDVAAIEAVHRIMERLHRELLRLRLIVSETDDLRDSSLDPLEPTSYAVGPRVMLIEAVEVVIELRDGRRYLCTGWHRLERGWL